MDAEALRRHYAVELSQAELEANPYPVYARLQREQPLAWVDNLGMWLVTRHADVSHGVGALPVDFDGREARRPLHDFSTNLACVPNDLVLRRNRSIVERLNLSVHIIRVALLT